MDSVEFIEKFLSDFTLCCCEMWREEMMEFHEHERELRGSDDRGKQARLTKYFPR
jgi:hypothetical protein